MSRSQHTWVRVGMVRMPALCAALLAAVAAHALVLAGIAAFFAWTSHDHPPAPPKPLYTMGQPIQVQLLDPPVEEPVPMDEPDPANTTDVDEKPAEAMPPDPVPDPEVRDSPQPQQAQPDLSAPIDPARAADPIWKRDVVTRSIEREITRTVESLAALIARLPELLEKAAPTQAADASDESAEPALAALPDPAPPKTEAAAPPDPKPDERDERTEQVDKVKADATSKAKPKPATTGLTRIAAVQRVPTPTYPERARRAGHEGTVLVEVEVLADGSVGDVSLHQSSGHRTLDRAATRAAKRGRYNPAMQEGKAITAWLIVPFEFNIEGR